MWERSARFNPISLRYRFYLDHRPILPQDPTWSFLRPSHSDYEMIYFLFRGKKSTKTILSNSIPVKDREQLKKLDRFLTHLNKNINLFSYIPAIFLTGFLFRLGSGSRLYGYKIMYPIVFYVSLCLTRGVIKANLSDHYTSAISYYYQKYSHLSVDNINKINDPRRKFFRVDTSSYYRESPHDIIHKQHHDAGHGGHGGNGGHHDTSTYYGPHPVSFF
jgi:hypothetical protein